MDPADMDGLASLEGQTIPWGCTCGATIRLTCHEVRPRVCPDCGGLHRDVLFVGACQRCEALHEATATLEEPDDPTDPDGS